jgi:hypothetical protein
MTRQEALEYVRTSDARYFIYGEPPATTRAETLEAIEGMEDEAWGDGEVEAIDEISAAILLGEIEIVEVSECECRIEWTYTEDGIEPDTASDCCWSGIELYAIIGRDRDLVARQEAGESVDWQIDPMELHEWAQNRVLAEMYDNWDNPSHDDLLKTSLIEWLTEQEERGALLYSNPMRGFANEYSMIIIRPESGTIDIENDDLKDPNLWEYETAESWAIRFLRKDDAGTKMYTGCKVF